MPSMMDSGLVLGHPSCQHGMVVAYSFHCPFHTCMHMYTNTLTFAMSVSFFQGESAPWYKKTTIWLQRRTVQ